MSETREAFNPTQLVLSNVPAPEGGKQFAIIIIMLLEATIGAVVEWIVDIYMDKHCGNNEIREPKLFEKIILARMCRVLYKKELKKNHSSVKEMVGNFEEDIPSLVYEALLKTAENATEEQLEQLKGLVK